MSYNHGLEEKRFNEYWNVIAKNYRKAGMTEEQIMSMLEFEREVFNSDRRYRENTVELFGNESNPMLQIYDNYLSDNRYGWLDDIDNPDAYEKIMAMPEIWSEAFTLYIFDGYNQQQISSILLRNQSNISRAIDKIAEVLRNYFSDA